MAGRIVHRGIIEEEAGHGIYQVQCSGDTACGACHARAICGMDKGTGHHLEIHAEPGAYRKGEEVLVVLRQSAGYRALFYGYILPFLLIFAALITGSIFMTELLAGLFALSLLLPYYLMLYLMRHRMKQRFSFSLEKR